MISWIKKYFNIPITKKREYDSYEQTQLSRLERYKTSCDCIGSYKYTDHYDAIYRVKVLGEYSYYDIDGTVSGIVVEMDSGKIIRVNNLYDTKPHDWIVYLSYGNKLIYSNDMKYITKDELSERFLQQVPIDKRREIKLNILLSKK